MSISIVRGEAQPSRLGHFSHYCRKGKDYTNLYGKHVGDGSLTPYIDAAFDERVEEYVQTTPNFVYSF